MEVCVSDARLRAIFNWKFSDGSVVRDVLTRFIQVQEVPLDDFYVVRNGRRAEVEEPLHNGAVYHLEPRLRGGKGGFGSMLRALGAQIEKTTNREACRDLSGRRLRDVNHEKEMAAWLKKQAEREAEKEQRRLERLQRKLSEPKHQFSDTEYQQQCHDLSERLEDSVLKGLQAASSSQVTVSDASGKRASSDQSEQPERKRKKKTATAATAAAAAAACFWMGAEDLDELSSEDEDDEDSEDEESPSTSSSCGAVTVTTHRKEAEPEQSSRPTEDQRPLQSTDLSPPESKDQTSSPSETTDQSPSPPESANQTQSPLEDQKPPETRDQSPSPSPAETRDQTPSSPETRDQTPSPPKEVKPQQQQVGVDLSSLSSVDQLASLGLEVLKEELMRRGLKCGGTLSERAARLFSVRGLSLDQIDPALLAKPTKTKKK